MPCIDLKFDHGSTGVVYPVRSRQDIGVFNYIVINNGLSEIARLEPFPRAVVDLGCHSGYFLLHLEHLRRSRNAPPFRAVAIDADPQAIADSTRNLAVNSMLENCHVLHALVGPIGKPVTFYSSRDGYVSSITRALRTRKKITMISGDLAPRVFKLLGQDTIDLLKVDIEGAEKFLLSDHQNLLRRARHLHIDWHGWSGISWPDFKAQLAGIGFRVVSEELQQNEMAQCLLVNQNLT